MAIYSRSEDALQNAGVKPEWVSPSGDSSKATYDAAVAKCKEEIKAATTDAIQQIPAARIDTCLIYKGWRQRSTSK